MNLDPYGLANNDIALDERIKAFNKALEDHGAKDPHMLSFDLKVTPQIVIAYYELNVIERDELSFLRKKKLDVGLISVLMNIEPEVRKKVYARIDEFLADERPVSRIIDFVNSGGGSMAVRDLYEKVDKAYWGAVASYLKDTATVSGTITKGFRSMLVGIATYDASDKQLQWLERAIFHDHAEKLRIFTAPTFEKKFPEAVAAVGEFLKQNRRRYGNET